MAIQTIAGPIFVSIDTNTIAIKGDWTYNIGRNKSEEIMGTDSSDFHGIKETPQLAKLSGKGVVTPAMFAKLGEILTLRNGTVTLTLPSGMGFFTLSNAFQSGDGDASTESGEVTLEFKGIGTITPAA